MALLRYCRLFHQTISLKTPFSYSVRPCPCIATVDLVKVSNRLAFSPIVSILSSSACVRIGIPSHDSCGKPSIVRPPYKNTGERAHKWYTLYASMCFIRVYRVMLMYKPWQKDVGRGLSRWRCRRDAVIIKPTKVGFPLCTPPLATKV